MRIVAAVLGALLVLTSAGLLAGGGLLLWADRTQRDAAGYLVSSRQELNTGTYALATPAIDIGVVPSWLAPRGVLDAVRIRVTAIDPTASAFVGIGPAAEVDRYLADIRYARVSDLTHPEDATIHAGGPPASAPTEQTFWAASSSGTGTRTVVWEVPPGSWTIVVMNPDGSSGIDVLADAGAKIPILDGIAASLLIGGLVVLVIGLAVLIGVTVRAGGRTRQTSRR